eukprot:452952-Rhodomonas_salina.1
MRFFTLPLPSFLQSVDTRVPVRLLYCYAPEPRLLAAHRALRLSYAHTSPGSPNVPWSSWFFLSRVWIHCHFLGIPTSNLVSPVFESRPTSFYGQPRRTVASGGILTVVLTLLVPWKYVFVYLLRKISEHSNKSIGNILRPGTPAVPLRSGNLGSPDLTLFLPGYRPSSTRMDYVVHTFAGPLSTVLQLTNILDHAPTHFVPFLRIRLQQGTSEFSKKHADPPV